MKIPKGDSHRVMWAKQILIKRFATMSTNDDDGMWHKNSTS